MWHPSAEPELKPHRDLITMRKDLWLWELKWTAAEVAGIALGLATQGSAAAALAPLILFGTMLGSGVVRYRHYTNLPVDLGPSLEG